MSFWRIAWKNIQQRWLASSLTALSMALGVAVMVCVIVIHAVSVKQFSQDAQGYHLIVGGKGGKLQLVLTTVYHLGQPLYPVPYDYYRQFTDGRYADLTEVAIPYCMGDSFDPSTDPEQPSKLRFRVVATTPDLFEKIEYGANADGSPKEYTFRNGKNFRAEYAFEAVLGSVVASQAGLKVGDRINPTHGISGKGDKHQEFVVSGILDSTGTANDRAVFVNIEGFYLLKGHALKPTEETIHDLVAGAKLAEELSWKVGNRIAIVKQLDGGLDQVTQFEVQGIRKPTDQISDSSLATDFGFDPVAELKESFSKDSQQKSDQKIAKPKGPLKGRLAPTILYNNEGETIESLPYDQREVTSILVLCSSNLASGVLNQKINKDATQAVQAVPPAGEVTKLLENIVGPMQLVLLVLTILIVLVAAISILVSIYNSMSERSHDIAIMRAVGASRASVMQIILTESVLLSLAGGVLGIFLGHAFIALASPYVESQAGVRLAFWEFDPWELAVIPGLVALATLAGLLPAATAYRTDVADSLR